MDGDTVSITEVLNWTDGRREGDTVSQRILDRQGEKQYHRGIELDGWREIQEALNQTDGQRKIQSVSQRP